MIYTHQYAEEDETLQNNINEAFASVVSYHSLGLGFKASSTNLTATSEHPYDDW